MRMRLSYKLFAAFFLILAIVVSAMILSRYIFSLNFRHYIRQVELEKIKSLIPVLQEEYRRQGSLSTMAADPARWQRLVRVLPEKRENHPSLLPEMEPHGGLKPPPKGEHPPSKNAPPPGRPPGILLLDTLKRPIIGMPAPLNQLDLVAVEVDGQIVGWLGLHLHEPFKSGPPAILLERQTRHLLLLGGSVIGLTALIAFILSRHLLKPILQLTEGTRELANRNFSVRIPSATKDELGLLAENFNTMAHTLEEFENMRKQWLTDISHELRTPLSILRGEIEALQDGVRKPTPVSLASLHDEILRISKLVEDLHLLSMADSDRLFLNKKRISPVEILGKIANAYQPRFEQRNIHLEVCLEDIKTVCIKGDSDRLEQVFTNIFENACKYVSKESEFNITGRADNEVLALYFQDSGPGVPEADLSKLFDRLYRVDGSRSRNTGGSGLGLSICRRIVENHGGRIWAEKSPMGGLSICMNLPINRTDKK